LKGSTIGTSTDPSGYYEIEVPSPNSTIVFSYTGYVTQEVYVGKQKIIHVRMDPDLQKLSEVVVVGYGAATRKQMTAGVAINSPYTTGSYNFNLKEPYYPPHNT